MNTTKWLEIRLHVPEAQKDSVSNRLFELGASGVSEGSDGQGSYVSAFFDSGERDALEREMSSYLVELTRIFPDQPPAKLDLIPLADENWAERYKEFYRPQALGRAFYLVPAWERGIPVPEGRIPIFLEPGQAFGTGLHPSTQLSLGLMERAIEDAPAPAKVRLIDVGTGSGILAIAAAKIGVKDITAIDIDPIAVRAAEENSVMNGCPDIHLSADEIGVFSGIFDIVVANILLETHRALLSEYRRLLRPGGQLILSGLLGNQRAEIQALCAAESFVLEESESMQEWIALSFAMKGGA